MPMTVFCYGTKAEIGRMMEVNMIWISISGLILQKMSIIVLIF